MKKTPNRLIIFCLAMIIILSVTGLSEGAPEIVVTGVFTENMGPNSAGLIPGYKFIFSAFVSDPLGVPNNIKSVTTITLNQDQQDYTLSPTFPGPIFQGLYQLFPKPDYDGQIGEWIVKVTNKQNESHTMITNNLDKPRLIPLIENIRFSDSSTTPTISWNPVLFDDDLNPSTPDVEVDGYKIRFLRYVNDQFYRSDLISGTTFKVPASILRPGETVFVRIEARDHDQENNTNE